MKIDAVRVGMVLNEQIKSPFADVLLDRGTVLTARQLSFIKRLGISDIDVLDNPNSSQGNNSQLAEALRRLAELRSDTDHSEAVKQLFADIRSVILSLLEQHA